jgi:hypothetical protein
MGYPDPMNTLENLNPEIRELLVRLPYRIGFYISESDQTGGKESSEAERIALENIVTFYVEDTVKSEFAHQVMNETLTHKKHWASWNENIHVLPEECLKIFDALTGVVDMKEVFSFKQNLLEIAIVVAQAYREFDKSAGAAQKLQIYISLLLRRIRAVFTGEEMQSNESLLNISPKERSAIKLLADTLGVVIKF